MESYRQRFQELKAATKFSRLRGTWWWKAQHAHLRERLFCESLLSNVVFLIEFASPFRRNEILDTVLQTRTQNKLWNNTI
jgi:hypothetical protein